MIIRWGRKGIVAGAYAIAFVTAAVIITPTQVKKYQHRPDVKQEVRYVTPVAQQVTTAYPNVGNDGVSDEELRLANIRRDDKEIIDLIKVAMQSGILDA